MPQESDAVLRNSLDAVDRLRTRIIVLVAMFFALLVLALGSMMASAAGRTGSDAGAAKLLFTSLAAQMFFVAGCTVVVTLYITRMTKTILRAIELTSREPPK
jgi:hypothetical protein